MSRTLAGDNLTEAHRLLTSRMANNFHREIRSTTLRVLPYNPGDWAQRVTDISDEYSHRFLQTTRAYHGLHRTAEGVTRAMKAPNPRTFPKRKALSTAYANGVAVLRQTELEGMKLSSRDLDGLGKQVAARLLLPAMEPARAYGRDFVAADPQAIGYARIGEGGECEFCAMLISRGAVYSKNSVNFEAHPNCRCTSEAVYSGWKDSPSSAAVREVMAEREGEEFEVDMDKDAGGGALGRVESVSVAERLIKERAVETLNPTFARPLDLGLSQLSISDVNTIDLPRWIDARVMMQEAAATAETQSRLRSLLETQALKVINDRISGGRLSSAEIAAVRGVTLEILTSRGL